MLYSYKIELSAITIAHRFKSKKDLAIQSCFKMAKAIIAILVLCLTYVNCQDPTSQACLDATTALGTSDCAAQLASGSNAVCSGTCGDLYSDVFDQCGLVSFLFLFFLF